MEAYLPLDLPLYPTAAPRDTSGKAALVFITAQAPLAGDTALSTPTFLTAEARLTVDFGSGGGGSATPSPRLFCKCSF
jgi:hypothetical protein